MAKEFPRSHRVADQIQQELSVLIRDDLKDPRLSHLLTITSVDVTRDLSIAKVYYSIMDDLADRAENQEVLRKSAGFLRRRLASVLKLRAVPELHFRYDDSIEEGARMSALIAQAVDSNTTEADSDDETSGADKDEDSV